MHIHYFFRKSRAGAFSIEQLFSTVQQEFPRQVSYSNYYMSCDSSGLLNRLKLVWEAYRKRGSINHVTGDINFITLLLPKTKTILTIHDIESLERNGRIKSAILKFFWLQVPVAGSKFITVVSECTRQKLFQTLSVDKDKVHVIPNIISPLFSYHPKEFCRKEPMFLQIGTKYNKNLKRTIAALENINCKMVIVGELDEEHVQLLNRHGVNYINHVGVSSDKLRELYAQADIITFVSLFEGFGMPILEAQATGRVVVTSNCSSMPEVAGDGALLVDPYSVESIREAYLNIFHNDVLREDLIKKGLENVKRFSNKVIAQQYLDLYSKL